MPVEPCKLDDTPGFRYGTNGKCYTYDSSSELSKKEAFQKAMRQMKARFANKRNLT